MIRKNGIVNEELPSGQGFVEFVGEGGRPRLWRAAALAVPASS